MLVCARETSSITISCLLGTAKSPNILSALSINILDGLAKRQLDAAFIKDKGIVQVYA